MDTLKLRAVDSVVVGSSVVSSGRGLVRPEASLSLEAGLVLEAMRGLRDAKGEVSEGQLKVRLLGVDVVGALVELRGAWLVLGLPGHGGGRGGRERRWVVVEQGVRPGPQVRARHAVVLSGRSGTLGAFAGWLGLSRVDALGVMRALVEGGLASGGPVGATFAFRVWDVGIFYFIEEGSRIPYLLPPFSSSGSSSSLGMHSPRRDRETKENP